MEWHQATLLAGPTWASAAALTAPVRVCACPSRAGRRNLGYRFNVLRHIGVTSSLRDKHQARDAAT